MSKEYLVKKSFLVRFQYGFEKNTTLNKTTSGIVEKRPVTEESEGPRISEKTNETVALEKGCYSVYFCVVKF